MESIWLLALMGAGKGILTRCRRENPLTGSTETATNKKLAIILTEFLEIDMTINFFYKQREDEEREERCAKQSANDDDGQWSLALTADAVAQGCRHEAEHSHHSCH